MEEKLKFQFFIKILKKNEFFIRSKVSLLLMLKVQTQEIVTSFVSLKDQTDFLIQFERP